MEKMEVDDVVDLSVSAVPREGAGVRAMSGEIGGSDAASMGISQATARDLRALTQNSGLTITPAPPPSLPPPVAPAAGGVVGGQMAMMTQDNGKTEIRGKRDSTIDCRLFVGVDSGRPTRRVLRPRTEPRSYAESPDIVLLPSRVNGRQHNGNIDSDTDDDDEDDDEDAEMPPMCPIKELSPAELRDRERNLRKLREELRNEETKLILLKKLKQSQQIMMKENLIVTPSTNNTSNNNSTNMLSNSTSSMMNNVNNIMNNSNLSNLAGLPKGSLSVTPTHGPMPAHKNRTNVNVLR